MGMAYEFDDLRDILVKLNAENIQIFSDAVNKSTDLTVSARPLCFDVAIGKDLIYSCSHLENARTIFDAIRADLKGEVFHGNTSKAEF